MDAVFSQQKSMILHTFWNFRFVQLKGRLLEDDALVQLELMPLVNMQLHWNTLSMRRRQRVVLPIYRPGSNHLARLVNFIQREKPWRNFRR